MRRVMVRHHVKGDDGKWYLTGKGEHVRFLTPNAELSGPPGGSA